MPAALISAYIFIFDLIAHCFQFRLRGERNNRATSGKSAGVLMRVTRYKLGGLLVISLCAGVVATAAIDLRPVSCLARSVALAICSHHGKASA
ncbi:MAG TPA: hypothetical protein VH187_16720 [Scandinavium sp.]|uniref:hypothetical protein n=1 Tax=Scandinavium sp. TaxID=2830653 RepID=UPI002E31F220|nr:hypothetical protein [Scandinavium sp.]HEX4502782.1 hypothetical protein [Scandinavium sp.]